MLRDDGRNIVLQGRDAVIRYFTFRWLSLLWVTALLTPHAAAAENTAFQSLTGVRVKVEIDVALQEDGLGAKQIQSDVERRLRGR